MLPSIKRDFSCLKFASRFCWSGALYGGLDVLFLAFLYLYEDVASYCLKDG